MAGIAPLPLASSILLLYLNVVGPHATAIFWQRVRIKNQHTHHGKQRTRKGLHVNDIITQYWTVWVHAKEYRMALFLRFRILLIRSLDTSCSFKYLILLSVCNCNSIWCINRILKMISREKKLNYISHLCFGLIKLIFLKNRLNRTFFSITK